jgi:hypothetical protein
MKWGLWAVALATAVGSSLTACGDSSQPGEEAETTASLDQHLTKGAPGALVGDTNYCDDPAHPCALGEGDCDPGVPGQCASGLTCVPGNLAKRGAASGDACAPATCGNGTKDGDETSIDCGGSCGSDCVIACDATNGSTNKCSSDCLCGVGEGQCDTSAECAPGLVCGINNGAAFHLPSGTDVCWGTTCQNGTKDGNETDIDCGGSCAPCTPPAASPVSLASAAAGALLHIVIAPHTDTALHTQIQDIANDLRDKLNAIKGAAGAAFVVDAPTNTPGGISLGIDGDFPSTGWPYQGHFRPNDTLVGGVIRPQRLELKEQYVLHTPQGSNRVIVAGATVDALRAAVWDLLGRAGYRHYFPTPTWEVIPSAPSLTLNLAVDERPAFLSRTLNFPGNTWETAFSTQSTTYFNEWRKHNRLHTTGTAIAPGGGGYGTVVSWWQTRYGTTFPPELSTDPVPNQNNRQYCLTGVATVGGTTWTVEKVVKDWAQNQVGGTTLTLTPNVNISWASAPKAGGGLHCNDINDPKFKSIANRMAAILNAAAEGAPTKIISAVLRSDIADPPTLALRQNVAVSLHASTAAAVPFTFERRVRNWGASSFEVGLADYLGNAGNDYPGQVQLSTRSIIDRVTTLYGFGARRYDLDVNWGFGASGPTWWALAKAFWELDTPGQVDAAAYRNDFLQNAFGPAADAMSPFYGVIEDRALWSSNMVGVMYRSLQQAFSLTTAAQYAPIRARLEDLAVYARYLELSRKFWNRCDAQSPDTEQSQLKDLLRFTFATRDRRILKSYEATYEVANSFANCAGGVEPASGAPACDLSEWGVNCPSPTQTAACGTCFGSSLPPTSCNQMKNGTAPTSAELLAMVNGGASNIPILDTTLIKEFSKDLVHYPLTPTLPPRLQSIYTKQPHYLLFQRPPSAGPLTAHVIKYSPGAPMLTGRLSLPATPDTALEYRFLPPDPTGETDWVFENATSAVHRLDLDDSGSRMFTSFPAGTRVAVPIGPKDIPLQINYRWAAYIFVPAGTANVVGWSQGDGTFFRYRKVNGAWTSTMGYLSDYAVGNACTTPHDIASGGLTGLWDHFVIPVSPAALTDELWLFNDGSAGTVGERLMLSVPPYLYQSPEGLLVPREVAPETTNPTPCTSNANCAAGQFCTQGGTCRTEGGGCSTSSNCPVGQSCDAGVCSCIGSCSAQCPCAGGRVCTSDNQCASGLSCVAGTCQNCSTVGCTDAACTSTSDCANGLTCLGGSCTFVDCTLHPELGPCAPGTGTALSYINDHSALDVEMVTKVRFNATGNRAGFIARLIESTPPGNPDYIAARIGTALNDTWKLYAHINGADVTIQDGPAITTALPFAGMAEGASFLMRFRIRNSLTDGSVFAGIKLWLEDQAEPAAWTIEKALTAATDAQVLNRFGATPGRFGLYANNAQPQRTITFDDFKATFYEGLGNGDPGIAAPSKPLLRASAAYRQCTPNHPCAAAEACCTQDADCATGTSCTSLQSEALGLGSHALTCTVNQ